MTPVIVDYGSGNLASVQSALRSAGGSPTISSDPEKVSRARQLVLPGVGSFLEAMTLLRSSGLGEAILEAVNHECTLLGICLGMQLLASQGDEGGTGVGCAGLGLISGTVSRLQTESSERIPHVGWNEVLHDDHRLFQGIPSRTDFYFVHSYRFLPDRKADIIAQTPYCGKFVSAVARDRIFGVQFHPEKSSRPGSQLIRNFLGMARC